MVQKNKITVFYDGACGLCHREISHYKKIAPPNVFEWIDITVQGEKFTALGFKLSEGLKALHVKDINGQIYLGVDAFIVIWQNIAGWKYLAVLIRFYPVKIVAGFLYKHFANWRFKKLGYQE